MNTTAQSLVTQSSDIDQLLSLDPDEFSLDDLLQESMAYKTSHEAVKVARQRLAGGRLAKTDSDSLNMLVSQWEMKREWTSQAYVVMFSRQMCACGEFHHQFNGYFQRQVHRTTSITRWISSPKPQDKLLARESKYEDSLIDICHVCAEFEDWELQES